MTRDPLSPAKSLETRLLFVELLILFHVHKDTTRHQLLTHGGAAAQHNSIGLAASMRAFVNPESGKMYSFGVLRWQASQSPITITTQTRKNMTARDALPPECTLV